MDDQLDDEELEAIRKQSMAGLFMGFSMAKNEPGQKKKKTKRRRTPRSGLISEDSMEDMVSEDLDASNLQADNRNQGTAGGKH